MHFERISAGFYTQPTHVSTSNTWRHVGHDTSTGPVALEPLVADSVSSAHRINEVLHLTSSHQEEFVLTVDVPVPQNLEGRFEESTQEFIIEQIGDRIVDLPVLEITPEIIVVLAVTETAQSSRVEHVGGICTCCHLCSTSVSDRIRGSSTCRYLCCTNSSDRVCVILILPLPMQRQRLRPNS